MFRVALAIALMVIPPAAWGAPVEHCADEATEVPAPFWETLLSQPAGEPRMERTFLVPSFDGVLLSAKVYQPLGAEPAPTILLFTPYNGALGTFGKDTEGVLIDHADCMIPYYTARGYNVVLADMRGTRGSGGCFQMGSLVDGDDGAALVDWIAAQPWSNGRVGMVGGSHAGLSQLLTASHAPAALKTIVPVAAPARMYDYLHMDGARYLANTLTPVAYAAAVDDSPCPKDYLRSAYESSGDFDAFWAERDPLPGLAEARVPTLLVHGLQDENVKTNNFELTWNALEGPRKLFLHQGGHTFPDTPWWNLTLLRWFDHWLRGIDTGMLEEPAVSYERDDGSYATAAAWPPPKVRTETLYLSEGLLQKHAAKVPGEASYVDVPLAFRTAYPEGSSVAYDGLALRGALAGAGRVAFTARVAAQDTQFAVVLWEGAEEVTRGYLDARHRAYLEEGVDLAPGAPYRFEVALYPRAHVFHGGELRLTIASSDGCLWFNSGADPCAGAGIHSDPPAAVTIVEDRSSRLELPLERGSAHAQ